MPPKIIPLSVPAEESIDAPHESVDALMTSIRQLVSGQELADDIIDLNRPVSSDGWQLSEKTVSESSDALSSFISALQEPKNQDDLYSNDSYGNDQAAQNKTSSDQPGHEKGFKLEAFVAQCLHTSLNQWLHDHGEEVRAMVRGQVSQRVNQLVQQWLDAHLPGLIKESIDHHLQALVHGIRKRP
jgi:hypothetical protein